MNPWTHSFDVLLRYVNEKDKEDMFLGYLTVAIAGDGTAQVQLLDQRYARVAGLAAVPVSFACLARRVRRHMYDSRVWAHWEDVEVQMLRLLKQDGEH